MLTVFSNILKFITDPKNTRMFLFAGIVVFALLFLRQCNKTANLKQQVKIEQAENKRIVNNYNAAQDSIEAYQIKEGTWRSEKLGYEITQEELKEEYSDLLGDFEVEKNKPPIVITETVTEIKEIIKEVPVFVYTDTNGVKNFTFADTARYSKGNSRTLIGNIPFEIAYKDKNDSTIIHTDSVNIYADIIPGEAEFKLEQEITLQTGLFKNKETGEIEIKVDTKYPNMKIVGLEGALIQQPETKEDRKLIRQLRKTWGIGLNFGYGFAASPRDGTFVQGPYVGVGLTYTPKLLQWGK